MCEASGQTLTCRSRHLGGNISSAANLSFRAAQPGTYVFNATVEIEGEPDTNPANNAATRTVTVGSAPTAAKPCIVPNVIRRTPPVARRAILRAGCRLGVTRTALSATVRKGLVMRQTPVARKRVAGGTKVTLVVSLGKCPATNVQNLCGRVTHGWVRLRRRSVKPFAAFRRAS